MLTLQTGVVAKILVEKENLTEVMIQFTENLGKAYNFHLFTGRPQIGDEVVLNTTAEELNLGSGGYHYIVYNLSERQRNIVKSPGHIMKLRYTPLQFSVFASEEEASPHHWSLKNADSLAGTPVVIGLLHSHLTPAVLALNWASREKLSIVYIMTDGGALPLAISQQVEELKNKNLIRGTITVGHAFGGDLEAVNIFSGLLAAKNIFKADVIIITMGPGMVGTSTKFGFSGVEQGQIANGVASLNGKPVVVPRMSFADNRLRHSGLSHHTRTILSQIILTQVWVGLPKLPKQQKELIWSQIRNEELDKRHIFLEQNTDFFPSMMERFQINISSMGRSYKEDPAFFDAAWASGLVAATLASSG